MLFTLPPLLEPETEPVAVVFATEPPELDPETVPVGVLDVNAVVNPIVPPEPPPLVLTILSALL